MKTTTNLLHIVEYYINNVQVKREEICEVSDPQKYWKQYTTLFSQSGLNSTILDVSEFSLKVKCVRNYDYMITYLQLQK